MGALAVWVCLLNTLIETPPLQYVQPLCRDHPVRENFQKACAPQGKKKATGGWALERGADVLYFALLCFGANAACYVLEEGLDRRAGRI